MKLAAYEGLFEGREGADLVAFGIMNPAKTAGDGQDPFLFEVSVPKGLSLLGKREFNAFVPGIDDLVYGNADQNIVGYDKKIERGRQAIVDLSAYKDAKKAGDTAAAEVSLAQFTQNQEYLGFGYLQQPEDGVPPVQLSYYSFHIMVYLAVFFGLLCLAYLVYGIKDTIEQKRWLLPLGVISFFLAMIASQAGWIVAEVGRQPWAIQNMLPVGVATSNLDAGNVMTTFWMFAILFTLLLLAEIRIMLNQIKKGPEGA
jgi:cytochrome d ubiquinol oxidase subunit I